MASEQLKLFLSIHRNLVHVLFTAAALLFFQSATFSATTDEEIVLSFNHPAVGQYYISAIYSEDKVFLPSMELFNLLYVHYEKGSTGQSLKGTWLSEDNTWEVNANTLQASIGKEKFTLTTADFRLGELDLYLSPALFERMFGLRFTVNMNTLSISLQSDKSLPIEEKRKHEQLQQELVQKKADVQDFPLLYPRNRKFIGAGMVDYSLSMYAENNNLSGVYNFKGGMEFLGGDLQGSVNGAVGKTSAPLKATGLSWRYVMSENPFLTSVWAGQLSTTGLLGQRIVGGAISNDPIEPRKTCNTYSIDGNTVPQSEVELYINNQLSDYARADELGYYRFTFPLTYGTVRINLRIYTPSGQIFTEERQLQIPYTFLPKGVLSYNIQGGAIDDGSTEINYNHYAAHGDVAYGLTNELTAKFGTDYLSFYKKPLYYGSLSARVFEQYLMNIDIAPDAYYRLSAGVNYASSRSFAMIYTIFSNDSLYNPHHARQEFEGSVYLPFRMFGLQTGLRWGGEYYWLDQASLTYYNVDFNICLGRFNLRANYRDQFVASKEKNYFGNGLFTGSVIYTVSRTPGIPVFVKGMFLRAQAQYNMRTDQITIVGAQFSQTVMKNGRLNVNVDQDLQGKTTRFQVGFTLDLDAIRSTTQYTGSGNKYLIQQSFNGSIGLDARSAKLNTTNREQVGRAAVSVLMFVDSNNNGKFDKGEEKVPARAIRLGESATMELGKDSILRITQIQSYWQYNAEIVQSALPNPNLAPKISKFSFIADPNRYKRIEIPLYQTGVVEGKVVLRSDNGDEGIGGLRLMLKGIDHTYAETIRTFSDGGFYAMNLLPGKYALAVDSIQLSFLDATSDPVNLGFEVQALAEGDYIEGLNFILTQTKSAKDSINDSIPAVTEPVNKPSPQQKQDTPQVISPAQKENKPVSPAETPKEKTPEKKTGSPTGTNPTPQSVKAVATIPVIEPATGEPFYAVQLVASPMPVNMETYFSKIIKAFPGLSITETQGKDKLYRYAAGSFKSKAEAAELMIQIKATGWKDCFVAKVSK